MREIDASDAKLIMRFDKPVRSAQGMAVYGDLVFQLFHTGQCAVFDLNSRKEAPLAFFPLGSANAGDPTDDYINHANQCMFSDAHRNGNPLPLLYVTAGYGIGANDEGYYYHCAVEDIRLQYDDKGAVIGGGSTCVQTIRYQDGPMEGLPWKQPCWGCPAWFVDNRERYIYMFSARYRTTEAFKHLYAENEYIITRFPLPDPLKGGAVRFGPQDILDQFTAPFDIPFTQGGMIAGNKLFYTFGLGDSRYPDGLRVYDLDQKRLCARADLSHTVFGREEIESCSFWRGQLICNTNAKPQGGFYNLGSLWAELTGDGA
ncbi:MAG: hypothetical protein IJ240_00250 [Clostridia bacterium]|nr:hypothetical protein [Clostridia bacterium]